MRLLALLSLLFWWFSKTVSLSFDLTLARVLFLAKSKVAREPKVAHEPIATRERKAKWLASQTKSGS